MTTTSNHTSAAHNAAQKKEEKSMETQVQAQTGKNTDYSMFRACVDGIIKDFKSDSQELEMIVSMVPVQDELSKENVIHLIKGDKTLYQPKARSNAAAGSVTKPTPANQQRGALLALLPHYAEIVKTSAQSFANTVSELAIAQKAAKAGKKLSEKQEKALLEASKTKATKKNASKGEAELKIAAIEEMFSRAIGKLYLLRRISASNVKLNRKDKTISYDGFDFETDSGKVKLASTMSSYTKTLAELKRDANSVLKADGVTAIRGKGKGASATKTSATAPTPTATATVNVADTTANNCKVLNAMVNGLTKAKNKAQLVEFKKAEAPKQSFNVLVAALFCNEGKLDLNAFQKAIDVAMAKAKVGGKVIVQLDSIDTKAEKMSA